MCKDDQAKFEVSQAVLNGARTQVCSQALLGLCVWPATQITVPASTAKLPGVHLPVHTTTNASSKHLSKLISAPEASKPMASRKVNDYLVGIKTFRIHATYSTIFVGSYLLQEPSAFAVDIRSWNRRQTGRQTTPVSNRGILASMMSQVSPLLQIPDEIQSTIIQACKSLSIPGTK